MAKRGKNEFIWHFRGQLSAFCPFFALTFGILQITGLSVVSVRYRFSVLASHWTHLGRFKNPNAGATPRELHLNYVICACWFSAGVEARNAAKCPIVCRQPLQQRITWLKCQSDLRDCSRFSGGGARHYEAMKLSRKL